MLQLEPRTCPTGMAATSRSACEGVYRLRKEGAYPMQRVHVLHGSCSEPTMSGLTGIVRFLRLPESSHGRGHSVPDSPGPQSSRISSSPSLACNYTISTVSTSYPAERTPAPAVKRARRGRMHTHLLDELAALLARLAMTRLMRY